MFPGTVLGIELDGGATHGTHKARRRDRRRDRRLAAGGRITLRVGWEDMVDPVLERELAEDVLRLLGFEARADAISDGREHPVRRHR